jgi:NitT/TauT family transport system substrate-binding protein
VQQTAAGSVHVAGGVPDAAVLGIQQGAPVSIIAVAIKGSPLGVVARPDIEDWEDLRGQTVGVSALAGGEYALLRRLLAEHGLEEGDYDVIVSGPTPAKAAALNEGSVAAAVLFSPTDYNLESQGFRILGNTAELPLTDQVPLAVYIVNDEWAQSNDRGERVARVLVRANQWLQDPANREQAVEIFSTAAEQPAEHVATTYEFWFDELGIGTPDGMVSTDEIQNVIDMMADDGEISEPLPGPEEFIDTSYLEAAVEQAGSG